MLQHQICSFCEEHYQLTLRKKAVSGKLGIHGVPSRMLVTHAKPCCSKGEIAERATIHFYILRKVGL